MHISKWQIEVEVIIMCVVPTKISHQNCKETIGTYALLDNCDQGSFITQLNGQKLSMNLKTLTGEKSKEPLIVDNLKVAGVNKIHDWVSFPKVHSKNTSS